MTLMEHDEPPTGELEQAVARTWMETFRIGQVGRNSDFFELGGDSLISMDLMEKLSLRVGLELPAVMLFQNPTPKQLARSINVLRFSSRSVPPPGYDSRALQQQSADDDIEFLLAMPGAQTATLLHYLRQSRSQFRQDLFVLSELQFKRNGFFVEIGAGDGVRLSNTCLLEREFGWQGVLAEPCAAFHAQLTANRLAAIETRCVWRDSGTTQRLVERDPPELSTLEAVDSLDGECHKRGAYNVETLSLNDLLAACRAPADMDYLSIDTEGGELDILSQLDFDSYRFALITCAHNLAYTRDDVYDLLTTHGYRRKYAEISKADDWYVRATS